MSTSYRDSGVDIDKGNQFVKRIAPIVKSTFSERVITDIGGFGALFSGSFPGMADPVLVSGTDGVGTKLKIAQMMGKHDTIGIDAVAMCVNDILVSGAQPLFFLDYLACGAIDVDRMTDIVKGLAEGCRLAGCSLIGGETAEHPGVMAPEEYDIAGFAVGVVDRSRIINGAAIAPGDIIIGLPSSGIHSNGFSLVRKIFLEMKGYRLDATFPDLAKPLGETILAPTRIYCKSVLAAMADGVAIKGMVHITGGGFYENIPRILPDTTAVNIDKRSVPTPPIFAMLQRDGSVEDREMFTTFNMGIGLMLFVEPGTADKALERLRSHCEEPIVIGEVVPLGADRVIIR